MSGGGRVDPVRHPLWICEGPSGADSIGHGACGVRNRRVPLMVLPLSQASPKLPPRRKAALEATLLEALLDLVDRYWSGCKSLHGNQAFLGESGGDGQQALALPLGSGPHTWPDRPRRLSP